MKRDLFKTLLSGKKAEEIDKMALEDWLAFPDVEERTVWENLEPELTEELIRAGRKAKETDFPQLLLSDYRELSRNGCRVHFEDKYFLRRRLVTRLTVAECAADNGEFLGKITDGLWMILEETSWCLPAHNSYIRDTPFLPVPDPARPVIDLFAAESAAILGLSEYLLRSRMEKVSPVIRKYLDQEIRIRILEPYLSYPFWWKGDGVQKLLNWTPWITQNILTALFSRTPDFWREGEKKAVLCQAARSLDYYLDIYGDDGCCDEGAQYFSHAGLCLFGCMDILERIMISISMASEQVRSAAMSLPKSRDRSRIKADMREEPFISALMAPAPARGAGSGECMNDLWREPLIRNIAAYISKMYVGNGYYLNFADCSPFPGHRTARDFLFGLRTGNEKLAAFAARDYREQEWPDRLMEGEENLYYHILQIFSHRELMKQPDSELVPEDSWFESTGLFVVRDTRFCLAVKAGSNADNHNHNDVGSVILYHDNRPYLIDLGVETYTAKTFSERRYEIWTMQSAYHNLPTFYDGEKAVMQKDGAEYHAVIAEKSSGRKKAWIAMELSKAYPDPRIISYHRKVTLYKGSRVEIEDDYRGSLSCVLSLMTYEEPVCEESDIRVGEIGTVKLEGAERIEIERCPIRDPRLAAAWKHDCFRIRIFFKQGKLLAAFYGS